MLFSSPPLKLGLSDEEIAKIHAMADVDGDGHISYREFVPICREILVRVYSESTQHDDDGGNKPASNWIELYSEKEGWMYLNKHTGAATYEMPPEMMNLVQSGDLLADVMIDILRHVLDNDPEPPELRGDATYAQLWAHLGASESGLYLHPAEAAYLQEQSPAPTDWVAFNLKDWCEGLSGHLLDFCARQPPKPRYWIYIRQVVRGGMIWYNKQTGNIQHEPPDSILDALHRLNQEDDLSAHAARLGAIQARKEALESERAAVAKADPGPNRAAAREITALEQELAEAQTELEQTEHHHTTLQSALDSAKQHQNADEVEIAILEDARVKFVQELGEARSAHDDEQAGLAGLVQKQQAQIEELSAQLRGRQSSLTQAQGALDDLTQEIKDVRKQKRIVTATSAEAESINSLRNKYEQLLADHAKVRATCEQRNKQIRVVRAQLGETKEKNTTLSKRAAEIEKIERRLIEITEAHATAKSFLHAKTQLLCTREKELGRVKAHLQELQSRETKRTELLADALARGGTPSDRRSFSRSAGSGVSTRPSSSSDLYATAGTKKRSPQKDSRRSPSRHTGSRSKALPALAPLPPDVDTQRYRKAKKGGAHPGSRHGSGRPNARHV